MKKTLKLWILATAIVAMCMFCSVLTTNAATNKATLKITTWSNTCTWADYDFGSYAVSATATTLTGVEKQLTCTLLDNAQKNIQVQIWATLTNGTSTIPWSGFTVQTVAWTVNWSLASDTAESAAQFTTARTLYDKGENKVGVLTISKVTIKGTIPWGTPAWQYTWDLNVTF